MTMTTNQLKASTSETSDELIVELLRQAGSLSVSELSRATEVTSTAVRQRLGRLMARGCVQRTSERARRGRPSHAYSLTEKGRRETAGDNYGDLALAMWKEVRAVKDPEVRRGLIGRIAETLAAAYREKVQGESLTGKMESLAAVFADRKIPFAVDQSSELPVLTALACPYPELAEQDRSVCAMERMLFSELVGTGLQLTSCRLDGSTCCTFETS
jgi:predicted ArsR family transcriptional regulator